MSKLRSKLYRLLSLCIVLLQIFALTATGALTVLQPTPVRAQGTAPGGVTTGLRFWVRADLDTFVDAGATPATPGQQVQQWNDQSSQALHVTQPTLSQRPTLRAGTEQSNFNNYLEFSNHYLGNPSVVMDRFTADLTMYATGFKTANAGIDTICSMGTNGNDPTLDITALNYNPWADGSSPAYVTHVDSPVVQGENLFVGMRALNGGTVFNNDLIADLNGSDHANNMEIRGAANAEMFVRVNIGSDLWPSGGGEDWTGAIVECFIYDQKLGGADLQKVRTYMAIRGGITLKNSDNWLSAAGTTVWDLGANAAFHNNVAGIGRDDASALDQRKSKSVHAGSLVTMDNGGPFAADNSFLLWGHDGGSPTYSVVHPPIGGMPTVRMGRIWKVQETGAVGAVQVTGPSQATHLLVANDAGFTSGLQEISLSGGSFPADFIDGQFFTFALSQPAPGGASADLRMWLRADGSGVTGALWPDSSGNGMNGVQNTAAYQPAVTGLINFNPAVTFDGSNDHYNVTGIFPDSTASTTFFFAAALNTSSFPVASRNLMEVGNDRPSMYFRNTRRPTSWAYDTSSPNESMHTRVYAVNEPGVFSYAFPNTNPKNFLIAANGAEETFTGADGTFPLAADAKIAGIVSANGYWSGPIGEAIAFTRVLTQQERRQVQSYLAIKYGVTLNHDYVASDGATISWDTAINTSYNNDIAGIGRDDASALNQKQSKSVNSGTLVTVGLGAIAADNGSNPNAFAADKSFLVWGSDTGSTALSVPYIPVSLPSSVTYVRMGRVWKVQETGP
ncbi:MAG: hypothetical protein KJZ93_24765, partial [Caldilineaceae bacterium]|nr:hypothetical protein [Caldilineaceae bacterium]